MTKLTKIRLRLNWFFAGTDQEGEFLVKPDTVNDMQ